MRIKNGGGRITAYDVNFPDATFQGALGGLEFQDHPARNHASLDEGFDLLAGDRRNYIFPVEHAGHVSEIDKMVGVDEFSAGGGHVVRIDIVKFAFGALAEARRDWKQVFTP